MSPPVPTERSNGSSTLLKSALRLGAQEAVIVVGAFLVYFLIRGAVVDRADEALARGRDLAQLQETLRLNWELEMQSWIIGHYWLIKVMNWIYFWGHMPVVIILAVYLYVRHRHEYFLTRNAFLASGAIAVVIYWLLPVAPPRLLPELGLVDTMAVYDRVGYNAQEASAFVNQYAAVPSLHFGWSLLLGLVVARVGRHPIALIAGIAWPVAMFLSVIMTGNHFVLDAVAGGLVCFAGWGIALLIERRVPIIAGRGNMRPLAALANQEREA